MDEATREVVAARAGRVCEYCSIREVDDAYSFHVEHDPTVGQVIDNLTQTR